MELNNAFDKVPHNRVVQPATAHGIQGKLANLPGSRRQSMVVDCCLSDWKLVTSDMPHRLVLANLYLRIRIRIQVAYSRMRMIQNENIGCIFSNQNENIGSKFTDYNKIGGMMNSEKGCFKVYIRIQFNWERGQESGRRNLIQVSAKSCILVSYTNIFVKLFATEGGGGHQLIFLIDILFFYL